MNARKVFAAIIVVLVGSIPVVFFAAAIWTAKTFSYSEKLANTGALLVFAIPVIGGLAWLAYDVTPSRVERRS